MNTDETKKPASEHLCELRAVYTAIRAELDCYPPAKVQAAFEGLSAIDQAVSADEEKHLDDPASELEDMREEAKYQEMEAALVNEFGESLTDLCNRAIALRNDSFDLWADVHMRIKEQTEEWKQTDEGQAAQAVREAILGIANSMGKLIPEEDQMAWWWEVPKEERENFLQTMRLRMLDENRQARH